MAMVKLIWIFITLHTNKHDKYHIGLRTKVHLNAEIFFSDLLECRVSKLSND